MTRKIILGAIIGGFFMLGAIDFSKGNFRLGLASLLLGIVNGLLLEGGE